MGVSNTGRNRRVRVRRRSFGNVGRARDTVLGYHKQNRQIVPRKPSKSKSRTGNDTLLLANADRDRGEIVKF